MEDAYAASKDLVERFLLHMHEMGIILHLAKTLDQVAEENHLSKIGAVTIEIGEVSGIVTDLFEDVEKASGPHGLRAQDRDDSRCHPLRGMRGELRDCHVRADLSILRKRGDLADSRE